MSYRKPQYANYGEHEIPFNDSLGDLEYFRFVEDRWSDAYEKRDMFALCNATMLYFIALKTRAKFDGDAYYKSIKEIEMKLKKVDLNRDGKLNPYELQFSNTVLKEAEETLMKIYMLLSDIKVDAGWTLKIEKEERLVTPAMEKLVNDYLPHAKEIMEKLVNNLTPSQI